MRMIYKVRAKIIEEKLGDFYEQLTDGTINSQRPDGEEIVASMTRAKLTAPGIVEDYGEVEGKSFWSYVESSKIAKGKA